jgi:hypothetical protein
MALNTNMKYWGLRPLYMSEARKTALLFPITNNYGTLLHVHDPALGVTAGTVERGATTGPFLGSILELFRTDGASKLAAANLVPVQYMAASPGASYTYFALVACDPHMYFSMQEDGVTSSLAITDNFGACDVSWPTVGNTTTGISSCQIDSNTISNTATLAVQLLKPYTDWYDIDAGQYNIAVATAANYGKWIVRIFNHQLGGGSLAVAFA